MSHFISTKVFTKISELDPFEVFDTTDEFVAVNNNVTKKITGLNLTESIVSIGNLASRAYVDAVVDGAPALLDTLNELATALNDDANFATTITTLISTKLASNDFNSYFDTALTSKTTSDVAEDVNLYYTQARFDSALAVKTTSDVAEGSNLYYTQARFDSALAARATTALAEGDNLYFTEQRVLDVVIPLVPTSIFNLDVPEVSVNLPGYLHYNGTTLSWESSTNPTFTSVTTSTLNVQNVAFTGTGAVTIASGNDLNFVAAGAITFNSTSISLGADGKLTLLADPTSDNHAATKGYVDNQITDVVAGQGFATLGYVENAITNAELDGGEF